MADFYIAQGDTASPLTATLEDAAGAPVNLAGATVTVTVRPTNGGGATVDAAPATNLQSGDGSDGSKGKVRYDWADGDTDTPGPYLAYFTATFDDATVQTFPNGGYILVEVTAAAPVAAATAFASSADLEQRLGVEFTADEHVRAAGLLATATGLIQLETRQTIFLVTDDTLIRRGVGADRIRLPQRPVVSVQSVQVNGVTLLEAPAAFLPGGWYIDGDEVVLYRHRGYMTRAFQMERGTLTVVYTHGYSVIPAVVKAVCMEMVVRVWVNPGAVAREQIGSTMTVYDNMRFSPSGLLMTDAERQALNLVLRRQAGSMVLR